MRHHTKDKGDQGLGFVISDLLSKGIQVAILLSEHLPFDCIAISPNGALSRVSVKYRSASEDKIHIELRSSWADRHGTHHKFNDSSEYDALAVYCPDTNKCYYIPSNLLHDIKTAITLRIKCQKRHKNMHMVEDFKDPLKIF